MTTAFPSAPSAFHVDEASIGDLHAALIEGRTTCAEVVGQYIDRCRAYNGVASRLVTAQGQPVPRGQGVVRAGAPLQFPTDTVAASTLLPDLEQYLGPPLEFGRLQATASDPAVMQQFGMLQGMPDGTQVNALSTLNIRGERSVTCRGDFDRHPALGPLPEGAPAVCELFRQQPDAMEQAAALDLLHGRQPDLAALPLYGVVFSFKDSFDTRDMRSTGGGDAAYDIDFPARDHSLVARLRSCGAIIFAKAVCTEYNGRAGDPGGRHEPQQILPSTLGYQRSTWGGNPANPYDTLRSAALGSSSGSALSVSVNLVMASLGEETRASCRGPSNHNAVALILPHKSLLAFHGGAIGADIHCDRTGVHALRISDCARILDALRDPVDGYYDTRDPWTTVARSSVPPLPWTSHLHTGPADGALQGLRLGIIRESMVHPQGSLTERPIVSAAAQEIKTVLGGRLGASLVESADPLWQADPGIEPMRTDFRRALARLVPLLMPELMFRLQPDGTPVFAEFAAAIERTEFAPGRFFGSGSMQPIDYLVALAEGRIRPPARLDIATVQQQELSNAFRFHISQYLSERAANWQARGHTETLSTWAALNARSRFWGDDQRAAFQNWEDIRDMRNPLGGRQGVTERLLLRELLRRVDMMVLSENRLDALVRLHTPFPPGLIGGAGQYGLPHNLTPESLYGPNAGLTELLVPAGYVTTAYDPVFKLSADRLRYEPTPSSTQTSVAAPGLPFSLVFRAEPGREDVLVRIASAYEAASQRRVPPPRFGRVRPERKRTG